MRLFKKLVILWMVVHLVVLGGIPAGAQTGVETEKVVANVQEEKQQFDMIVEQVQSIDSNNGTENIVQDQNVTGNQIQQMTYPNIEGDVHQTEVDSINLEQSVEVHAEQSQSVENVEKVDAVQEQGSLVEYSQSLNVSRKRNNKAKKPKLGQIKISLLKQKIIRTILIKLRKLKSKHTKKVKLILKKIYTKVIKKLLL